MEFLEDDTSWVFTVFAEFCWIAQSVGPIKKFILAFYFDKERFSLRARIFRGGGRTTPRAITESRHFCLIPSRFHQLCWRIDIFVQIPKPTK
jgi:hypothetical protein